MGERLVQAPHPLVDVPAHPPEPPERAPEPDCRLGVAMAGCPAQGRPQIVVVPLQAVQPGLLVGALEAGLGDLRQCHEDRRVPTPQDLPVDWRELLQRELANRLEQAHPRLAAVDQLPAEQALLDQRGERGRARLADLPRRVERAAADEYGESSQHRLLSRP